MNLFLAGLGFYFVCDGIGSIIVYEKQSNIEQLVRVIRSALGATLFVISLFYL